MSAAKKNKGKVSTSQLLTFMQGSYLDRTSRPIYALAYLFAFVVIHIIGTILISPEALDKAILQPGFKVVSFIWLQNALEYIGFSHRMAWVAPPLAMLVILVALQITSRTRWQIRPGDFLPMTVECILLAIPLVVLSLAMNRSIEPQHAVAGNQPKATVQAPLASGSIDTCKPLAATASDDTASQTRPARPNKLAANIVTGIGAGIYEELVFRLILMCLLMIVFQDLFNFDKKISIVTSVLISATLFSACHHWFPLNGAIQTGDTFVLSTFVFRLLAGIYFAILFAVRGFGITAGSHAFYDIIAAILNAFFYAASE